MNTAPGERLFHRLTKTPGRGPFAYKVVPENRCYICKKPLNIDPRKRYRKLNVRADGYYIFDRKVMAHHHQVCPGDHNLPPEMNHS